MTDTNTPATANDDAANDAAAEARFAAIMQEARARTLAAEPVRIPTPGPVNLNDPFPLMDTRADNWQRTIPAPEELPETIQQEALDYLAAREVWEETRETLGNQRGLMANAEEADRRLIAAQANAGKPLSDLSTLTPNRDKTVRTLAEAHAMHQTQSRAVLDTISALMAAMESNSDTITADLERQAAELADLAEGYRRGLSTIQQHAQRIDALAAFVTETDSRDMPDYRGRPLSVLPPLPKKVTGK